MINDSGIFSCYNIFVAQNFQSGNREEVFTLDLTDFVMLVTVNVVAYYICKWLDRHFFE